MTYEAAKKRAEPYTKIVEELSQMRRDTVDLVKKAVGEQRKTYALVNNRSEGNAPLTIQALRSSLQIEERERSLFRFRLLSTAEIDIARIDPCQEAAKPPVCPTL